MIKDPDIQPEHLEELRRYFKMPPESEVIYALGMLGDIIEGADEESINFSPSYIIEHISDARQIIMHAMERMQKEE